MKTVQIENSLSRAMMSATSRPSLSKRQWQKLNSSLLHLPTYPVSWTEEAALQPELQPASLACQSCWFKLSLWILPAVPEKEPGRQSRGPGTQAWCPFQLLKAGSPLQETPPQDPWWGASPQGYSPVYANEEQRARGDPESGPAGTLGQPWSHGIVWQAAQPAVRGRASVARQTWV